MRCAVNGCDQDNNSKASKISFFVFPKDATLRKKWIAFCCRDKRFNPNTSVICMFHFKPDDIVNRRQYEMGFNARRLLKDDAVPSIKLKFIKRENTAAVEAKRSTKIHTRFGGKKHLPTQMFNDEEKYDTESAEEDDEASSPMMEETPNEALGEFEEIHVSVDPSEFLLPDVVVKEESEIEIERLQGEIQLLKDENGVLQTAKGELEQQLVQLSEKMNKDSQTHQAQIDLLKAQLSQAKYEVKNLEEKILIILSNKQ